MRYLLDNSITNKNEKIIKFCNGMKVEHKEIQPLYENLYIRMGKILDYCKENQKHVENCLNW